MSGFELVLDKSAVQTPRQMYANLARVGYPVQYKYVHPSLLKAVSSCVSEYHNPKGACLNAPAALHIPSFTQSTPAQSFSSCELTKQAKHSAVCSTEH